MIQCVICEDWFHSKVSTKVLNIWSHYEHHFIFFCVLNTCIYSTWAALWLNLKSCKRWCVRLAWTKLLSCGRMPLTLLVSNLLVSSKSYLCYIVALTWWEWICYSPTEPPFIKISHSNKEEDVEVEVEEKSPEKRPRNEGSTSSDESRKAVRRSDWLLLSCIQFTTRWGWRVNHLS